jgi:hypothetical protein
MEYVTILLEGKSIEWSDYRLEKYSDGMRTHIRQKYGGLSFWRVETAFAFVAVEPECLGEFNDALEGSSEAPMKRKPWKLNESCHVLETSSTLVDDWRELIVPVHEIKRGVWERDVGEWAWHIREQLGLTDEQFAMRGFGGRVACVHAERNPWLDGE